MYYAYKIQNMVNGLRYIGITCDPIARWNAHRANAYQHNISTELYDAMRHFGESNFRFVVLAYTIEDAHRWDLEQILIAQYNTFEMGYNMTLGGNDRSNMIGMTPARLVSTGEHIGQVSLTDPRWELFEIESVFKVRTVHQFSKDKLSIQRLGSR